MARPEELSQKAQRGPRRYKAGARYTGDNAVTDDMTYWQLAYLIALYNGMSGEDAQTAAVKAASHAEEALRKLRERWGDNLGGY